MRWSGRADANVAVGESGPDQTVACAIEVKDVAGTRLVQRDIGGSGGGGVNRVGAEKLGRIEIVEGLSVLGFKCSGNGADDFAGNHFSIPAWGGVVTADVDTEVEGLIEVHSGHRRSTAEHSAQESFGHRDSAVGTGTVTGYSIVGRFAPGFRPDG